MSALADLAVASPTPSPSPPTVRRRVGVLAVLGDSTAVGIGDPLHDGTWRGVGHFVADAVGVTERGLVVNVATNGARVADVRRRQLSVALRHEPDVVLMIAGMNDTLRADFDSIQIAADLSAIAAEVDRAGSVLVTLRYHDHTRLFRLPAVLRQSLQGRIARLNDAIDGIAGRANVHVVDLATLPVDAAAMWSVDRLHPSEVGHRHLAGAIADELAAAGFAVPRPVSVDCGGGASITRTDRTWWMISQGIPWLLRRSADLLPFLALVAAGRAQSVARSVTTRRA